MPRRKVMSLEAALEEERKEIEALLRQENAERRAASRNRTRVRSPSPLVPPQSPVRSMLDVDAPKLAPAAANVSQPPTVPVRSMLDVDTPAPNRSMLDIDSPPTPAGQRFSAPPSARTSPTLSTRTPATSSNPSHTRSTSDSPSKLVDSGPRTPPIASAKLLDPTTAYQFSDIYATNVGQAVPGKRNHQAGLRSSSLGGPDLSALRLPGESGRAVTKQGSNQSKSPSSRLSFRASSPLGNPQAARNSTGSIMLDNGELLDKDNAYRRLSDANLAYGGSTLASYARKQTGSDGHGRVEKTNMSPYGELLADDDSDDDAGNSSDEEDHRGRKLTTRADNDKHEPQNEDSSRTVKSLLAAVEDERKRVAVQPQYRSLFEPEITLTSPSGEKAKQAKTNKQVVHPSTSFDQEPASSTQSPPDPEFESDVSAIKHAQRLQLTSTPILSSPEVHRSIRILYRGDFTKVQREAEEENRRLRKYICATDLSDESTHALEWAIGTILRDGDTLIAIYCMDEEASGSIDASNQVPDDPKSMREQAAAIEAMAKNPKPPGSPSPFYLHRPAVSPIMRTLSDSRSNTPTPSPAPSFRGSRSRLAEERERAVQDITDRVSRLLRKTQLQVRVIVECIHCKNPKHLITEVIDLVSPTLVILGSRGRSALKGTLLGSFSNYLVTKSSVPVMVARKRLRKKSKYQPPPLKQVNNLANPSARSLEQARID